MARGELLLTNLLDGPQTAPLHQPVSPSLYRGGNSFSMEKNGKYMAAVGPVDRLLVQGILRPFALFLRRASRTARMSAALASARPLACSRSAIVAVMVVRGGYPSDPHRNERLTGERGAPAIDARVHGLPA